MFVEFVLGCLLLVVLWVLLENRNGKHQPPGPPKYPFVGNLPQVMKAHPELSHVALHKLSLIYGPIMSIRMGFRDTVVLCGYKEMKDILTRDECSGRIHDSYLIDRTLGKEDGVIFTSGERWRKIRSVTVRALRDFGFGKAQTMESFLETESQNLLDEIHTNIKENNGIVKIDERYFHMGVLNTIWSLLAGVRYEWNDPKLLELLDANDRIFEVGNFGASLSFAFPSLRFIFPETFTTNLQKRLYGEIHNFMREIYQERKLCGEYKSEPQNVVDVFLKEADKEAGKPDAIFYEDQFVMMGLDLFQAGGETVAGFLGYALMMMISHPHVQKRIHEEIDSVCPRGTTPTLSNQNQMPYTQATLLEMLRFCHIVPLTPPRKFTGDMEYNGYRFKKGTAVLVNIYSASMDKEYWKDPEEFRPERFIGSNGQFVGDEHVCVFGFGKRLCLGDILAKAIVFIFFISMMQNFEMERVKGEPLPSMEPISGFTMRPKPFNIHFKKRA